MAILTPHQSQAGIATANAGQAAPYRSASAFMTPGQAALPSGLNQLARGDFANGAEDTLRLAMSNMPFVNLWYTRAALDWALLYHFREMLSPGTLRRTERKMKKEFGQTFLLPPSEYIKRGGGFR